MKYTPEEKEQIKRIIKNFTMMNEESKKIYVALGQGINIGAGTAGPKEV